ncbi:hypothetical protein H4Q26_010214 [Puccinia striiformis f. sp. tritici PST-130]|nr:hypothetical protein H4Q26_010214 [Puccinia striiformis f. sp. tritici PST-130]
MASMSAKATPASQRNWFSLVIFTALVQIFLVHNVASMPATHYINEGELEVASTSAQHPSYFNEDRFALQGLEDKNRPNKPLRSNEAHQKSETPLNMQNRNQSTPTRFHPHMQIQPFISLQATSLAPGCSPPKSHDLITLHTI